ncbi:MAG: S8 family serine peptidase [Marinifilaceae bacterium]|jgi:subtilisin family serine protease|nr:S8 family serine peptidase [Marinifilaceae bacterium]
MKIKIILVFVFVVFIYSCSEDNDIYKYETNIGNPISCHSDLNSNSDVVPNQKNVKFKKELISKFNNQKNELVYPTNCTELDEFMKSLSVVKISRLFPYAGKDEGKQVKSGLNRWYTLYYKDEAVVKRKTYNEKHVEFMEDVYIPKLDEYSIKLVDHNYTKATTGIFNDPYFPKQWNLENEGNIGNYFSIPQGQNIISSIKSADINAIKAWNINTGNPDVVVAIVDGGIDIHHPDLKANLWTNEDEVPDNNIDDDNNGFIDDIHGYNFVDNNGEIVGHDHGTHVAGVIAAVNNNGIGISSIAGGDGSPNSGVKIMSCQIFKPNPDYDPNDEDSPKSISTKSTSETARAIVYGANNGAIISQNSWSYNVGSTPRVVKDAIDYFNQNAGSSDVENNMKGGLVIFAASNDSSIKKHYPAAEKSVISVAAYAPDFSASWYTNYGNWIDISAPGGSSPYESKFPYESRFATSEVLSTVITPEGKSNYGYMQGTSMACPHVSGIAALIASKYMSSGYTAEQLKSKLLGATKSINPNDYTKPKYHNKMGRGFIDAFVALSDENKLIKPLNPNFVESDFETSPNSIKIKWNSPKSSDYKITEIAFYKLFVSESKITESNHKSDFVEKNIINAVYLSKDDEMDFVFNELDSGKEYYFALKTYLKNGNSSDLVILPNPVSTKVNHAPKISALKKYNNINLYGNDKLELFFKVNDPDKHQWTFKTNYNSYIQSERKNNQIIVRLFANNFYKGQKTLELEVIDEYGLSSVHRIIFNIIEDEKPYSKNKTRDIYVKLNKNTEIDLLDYIGDEDESKLKFTVVDLVSSQIITSVDGNLLNVLSKLKRNSTILIQACDSHDQKTNFTFELIPYSNEGIYRLYPSIVTDILYLALGDKIKGNVQIFVRNVAGSVVYESSIDTLELDPQKKTHVLNMSFLIPGKYKITIENNSKSYSEYFLKK